MLVIGVCQKCINRAAKKMKRKNIAWTGADTISWMSGFVHCPLLEDPGKFKMTEVLGSPPAWCEYGLEHAVVFARTKKYRRQERQEILKTQKQNRGI